MSAARLAPAPDPWRQDAVGVAAELATDVDHGLSAPEAAARLERYGPNQLDAAEPVPTVAQAPRPVRRPADLPAARCRRRVARGLGARGREGVPFEVIVISAIIVAQRRARLRAGGAGRAGGRRAAAHGGGHRRRACATGARSASRPPTSCRATSCCWRRATRSAPMPVWWRPPRCTVAEASLTGESEAVVKDVAPLAGPAALGDRVNMVFSGTAVTRGRGRAVVTATGMATEMGTVARLLGRTEEERTPLQREVDRIGRMLGLAVIVDRRRGRGRHPAHRRHRGGLRPRRRAARRRVAGGGGRARGAAGGPVGGARPRRAAHGAASGRSSRSCRRWRRWGRPRWCARTRPAP